MTDSTHEDGEEKDDAVAAPVERIVMCKTEDAFAFFAGSLIDKVESYFPGGEDEIARLSVEFQKEFESKMDSKGKWP